MWQKFLPGISGKPECFLYRDNPFYVAHENFSVLVFHLQISCDNVSHRCLEVVADVRVASIYIVRLHCSHRGFYPLA